MREASFLIWFVALPVVLVSIIVGAVVAENTRENAAFAIYSQEHHCRQTANYFDTVHEYTCDGGEKIIR